ncbi:MAG: hypothetical protein O2798_00065 [Chloroflexi bacterium]|nr:hypothetical protein [Chloroflexota bacterium]MDA1239217.1 hypothetical protein [Chloroflexota bacterium]
MAAGPSPGLLDLVRNGTMSPEIASTLAVAASERRSILAIAVPRLAGKTTVLNAALAYRRKRTPIHTLERRSDGGLGIPGKADGGYLFLSEISDAGFTDYFWGDEVQRVFAALDGFSLATALHAPGVDAAFEVICAWNGVPDEQAARIDVAVYIEVSGPMRRPVRRIAEVREIEAVRRGRPQGRSLHRWLPDVDQFEVVAAPVLIGSDTAGGAMSRLPEFSIED